MLTAAPDAIPYLGAPKVQLEALPELSIAFKHGYEHDGGASSDKLSIDKLSDLASSYEAIDGYNKERLSKALDFGKLSTSTFRAGRNARDRIIRLAEKMELKTLPATWTKRKIKEATKFYNSGNLEAASEILVNVFNQLKGNSGNSKHLAEIAISLGQCLALSGKQALAESDRGLAILNLTMGSWHQLRLFLKSDLTISFYGLQDASLSKACDQSLGGYFDDLLSIWILYLSKIQDSDLIGSIAVELASSKKDDYLAEFFVTLVEQQGNLDTLDIMVGRLIGAGFLSTAMMLVLRLAETHTFEACLAAAEFTTGCENEHVIYVLVKESARVNPRLADAIIRQLALRKRADELRSVAVKLAGSSDQAALYMILDQLVASEPDFVEFVSYLSKFIKTSKQIGSFSAWLLNAGLAKVLWVRVEALNMTGHGKLAAKWSKYLI